MKHLDVCNGDADGLCALHQWRLAFPVSSQLVTGVKRDIQLLAKIDVVAGDLVSVFDVSLDSNRVDAQRLLAAGVRLRWFDHHFAGEPIDHPALDASIDTSPTVCTSLLVDHALGGKYRAWAAVGAFGDNLGEAARSAAASLNLAPHQVETLSQLGELLNYNGYGDEVADLHFPPADLYRLMAPYADPLAFVSETSVFDDLQAGFDSDMAASASLAPCLATPSAVAYLLPEAAWARRVIGVMANRLATNAPNCAHALLAPNGSGTLTVSVRAPKSRPTGADELCRRFSTGGGRKAAAGINRLAPADMDFLLREFSEFFSE